MSDDRAAERIAEKARRFRQAMIVGWIITVAGIVTWTYALFVTGGPPLVDWTGHSPGWVAHMLPNRQSELGMVLSVIGSIPIYYVQFKQWLGP